ncbi:MAG: glycosyltransferase [Cyanomargarita calcarea GSE-NOS-MK-12-04C]|jgi:glycosyltransferase involved in cell wall biosynthesis|uniref:Glycosyltransferase n=1 Tax=Cyanomargarita calcarea GSE-NOS-MK-12-04C TaxID=2839659 RepID=A0A951UQ48_9CYAN|nr:glycosyltransferase [Cyanomargarita calcarea GSE-NOS-MK-12-04C]
MLRVLHSIHFPVSARSFVKPVVDYLNQSGIATELWVENHSKHSTVIQQLNVPKRLVASDLVFNPIEFIRRLSNYRRQLRVANPDILHTHQTRASLIPLLAAYLEKIPIRVYQNHGLPYLGYRGPLRWLLRSLEIINIRLATHVLLVSRSNLSAARKDRLLSANQGAVIANGSAVGIDLAEYELSSFSGHRKKQAKKKFGVAEAPFVLAYVGRPVRRKGFHLLLKAWEKSGLGLQNCFLLIAGCTANECEAALGHPVVGVKGLGYLTNLSKFYAACDAVTLPSEHEGFPYSLLEGAAAAKPLIGTDIPGIRCAIQPNQTGLLVPVNDELALANAISQLASDPVLRSRLGQNARKRVEQEFAREIVLTSLQDFYYKDLGCCPQAEPILRMGHLSHL